MNRAHFGSLAGCILDFESWRARLAMQFVCVCVAHIVPICKGTLFSSKQKTCLFECAKTGPPLHFEEKPVGNLNNADYTQ